MTSLSVHLSMLCKHRLNYMTKKFSFARRFFRSDARLYEKKGKATPTFVPKCECNHVTWGKREFVDLLSEEARKLTLLSSDNKKVKLHKDRKHDFIQLANAMEKLIFLQTWDDADAVANLFKAIDPDSIKGDEESREDSIERDFLSTLAPYLKQAGFTEVATADVEDLFMKHHRFGNVELQVKLKNFDFLRIWVFGQSGANQASNFFESVSRYRTLNALREKDFKTTTQLCHRRVVVAARHRDRENMIFKCFKDVPVGQFQVLLPDSKIQIPRFSKWALNIFLVSSGLVFFFNYGMWLQSEYKLGYLMVMLAVSFFIGYRTHIMYRNQRNRYQIIWKKMLYYKSTSNNSALVVEIVNRARGQIFKKTLLAYIAATQVQARSKVGTMSQGDIRKQCDALNDKMTRSYPDRQTGTINYDIGISTLLNTGILSCSKSNEYRVLDVPSALRKVEEELIALSKDVCDTS